VATILGLYITATRLSQNVQQICMYGNKFKGNYGPILEPVFGTRFHPSEEPDNESQTGFNTIFNTGFDVARQMSDDDNNGQSTTNDFDLSLIDPEVESAGFVLNYSIFYSAFRDIIVGFEVLVFYDVRGRQSYLAFFPQIHWQLNPEMTIQFGPGIVFTPIKVIPVFAHRVIFEKFVDNIP
jgi:hypothetical protein